MVEIRRGRGTFVASPRIVQELAELTGFVEDMRILGRIPTARVLSREIVSAAPLVAEKLGVPAGTRVVRIQRVRLSDGVPLSFDETYLPEDLGRRIMTDDLANEPIFTLLEERYDTPLIEAEYVLEAAAAEPAVATALEIPVGGPIFLIGASGNDLQPVRQRLLQRVRVSPWCSHRRAVRQWPGSTA